MRKLLLATVAVLSAAGGMVEAHAQAFPKPGTVTVRLNGRFRFYAAMIDANDAQNNLQGSPNGATPLSGTNKLANYQFGDYARLYPGFDGVAANGLKYGASLELRQDGGSGAGGGIYGSISQQSTARSTIYYRREWGYIGTDKLGTIRVGSTDGPMSLYLTGTFENFNDGGANGDVVALLPGNLYGYWWPFADNGNEYTTAKAIYLSPQFFGFDFGVSFEPNTGNVLNNSACGLGGYRSTNFVTPGGAVTGAFSTGSSAGSSAPGTQATTIGAAGANGQSIAGPGCDALSSTPTGDYTRRRNTFEGVLRYRGSFAGLGIAATAGYTTSGKVNDNATPQRPVQYDGLGIGDFGLAVTYGGLTVGGNYQRGRYNGTWGLDPKNGIDGEAWAAGASYTIGPVIMGVQYIDATSTGDLAQTLNGRQRREQAFSAGGTYSVAPGLALFLSYFYTQRKQNGFNFITGNSVAGLNNQHNKVTGQVIAIGTGLTW